jgi:hypothetical protein
MVGAPECSFVVPSSRTFRSLPIRGRGRPPERRVCNLNRCRTALGWLAPIENIDCLHPNNAEACNLMAVGNPRLDKIRFQLVISNRDTDLFAGSWMDSRPAGPAIAVALVRDISSPRTRRSRPKIRKKCLVLSPNRGNRGAVRREPPAQACQTARAVALAELRASSNSQPPHLEKLDPEKFGLQAVFAKIISSPPTAPTVMILAQVSSHSYKQ